MIIKNWQNVKKSLPYNWAQKVVEILTAQGFSFTRDNVKDVIRCRNKNPEDVEKVLLAIKKVKAEHIKKHKKIARLKQVI